MLSVGRVGMGQLTISLHAPEDNEYWSTNLEMGQLARLGKYNGQREALVVPREAYAVPRREKSPHPTQW